MAETGKIKSFRTKICPIIAIILDLIIDLIIFGLCAVPFISFFRYVFTGQTFIIRSMLDMRILYVCGVGSILHSFSILSQVTLSGSTIRYAIFCFYSGVTTLLSYYIDIKLLFCIFIGLLLLILAEPAKPDNLNDVLQYITDDYEI